MEGKGNGKCDPCSRLGDLRSRARKLFDLDNPQGRNLGSGVWPRPGTGGGATVQGEGGWAGLPCKLKSKLQLWLVQKVLRKRATD